MWGCRGSQTRKSSPPPCPQPLCQGGRLGARPPSIIHTASCRLHPRELGLLAGLLLALLLVEVNIVRMPGGPGVGFWRAPAAVFALGNHCQLRYLQVCPPGPGHVSAFAAACSANPTGLSPAPRGQRDSKEYPVASVELRRFEFERAIFRKISKTTPSTATVYLICIMIRRMCPGGKYRSLGAESTIQISSPTSKCEGP